jgi:hypothetical protein
MIADPEGTIRYEIPVVQGHRRILVMRDMQEVLPEQYLVDRYVKVKSTVNGDTRNPHVRFFIDAADLLEAFAKYDALMKDALSVALAAPVSKSQDNRQTFFDAQGNPIYQ